MESLILAYSLHEVDGGTRGLTPELWEAKNKTRSQPSAHCVPLDAPSQVQQRKENHVNCFKFPAEEFYLL
jgi:hypothetical protein